MKHNVKTLISTILVFALVAGFFAIMMPITASATENAQTIYLKGSGSSFDKNGWQNIFYEGNAEDAENPSVWHLVYSSGDVSAVTKMQITFTNGVVFEWTPSMGFSTNGGSNNAGWVIIVPYGWEIDYVDRGNNNNESGSFLVTTESGNSQFNISGFRQGTPDVVEPKTFTVTYDVNGGDGAGFTVPCSEGDNHYVLNDIDADAGVKFGSIFMGWNTAADGSGTSYVVEDDFTVTDDITLFAQWERITITEFSYDNSDLAIVEGTTGSGTRGSTTVTLTFELSDFTIVIVVQLFVNCMNCV